MTTDGTSTPVPGGRRLRVALRILLVVVLMLIGGAVVAYRRFTNPAQLVPLARSYLQQFAHGTVRLEKASFSWLDGLHLYNVTVDDPDLAASGAIAPGGSAVDATDPVFSCREVAVRFEPWRLLFGDPRIEAITLIHPTCLIVRTAGEANSDIAGLKLIQPRARGDGPVVRPAIELRDARFRVLHRDAHAIREVDALQVTVRGRPSARDPDTYELVWRGSAGEVTSGKATLNFREGSLTNLDGGLPWLSLEAVMIVINAQYDAAGTWSDLLGLQGRVRVRDYHITAVDGVVSPFAVIDLEHTALSIPLDAEQRDAPASERYLRFDDVHGTIQLMRDSIKMTFDGAFDSASCRVSASLKTVTGRVASLNDVQFEATIHVSGLVLPEPDGPDAQAGSRLFHRIPVLRRFYDEFSPRGLIDLSIEIARLPGADQPFNLRSTRLFVHEGRAEYARFPYELSKLSGLITVAPDGVKIVNLCGEGNGASVCINGALDQPSRCGRGTIAITATNVDVDDRLLAALPESVRNVLNRFQPSGDVDVRATLTRSGCAGGLPLPGMLRTEIQFQHLNVVYEPLPVPVSQITGRAVVTHNEVTLHDVHGRAGDASITASGRIVADKGGRHDVDLTLIADGMRLDDPFIHTLPSDVAARLLPFRPHGRFNAKTHIRHDHERDGVTFDAEIDLLGVSLDHQSFPLSLTGVEGRLRLSPDRLDIVHLQGKNGPTTVDITGSIDLARAKLNCLNVRAVNVVLDDELVSSLADEWGLRLGDWGINRLETVELEIKPDPADESKPVISGTAELRGATVTHARLSSPLTDVEANLTFGQGHLSGSLDRARLRNSLLSGVFSLDQDADTPLSVQVQALGLSFSDLAEIFAGAKNSLAMSAGRPIGSIDLEVDYRRSRASPNASPSSSYSGTATIVDLSLPLASIESQGPIEIHYKGIRNDDADTLRCFGKLNTNHFEYYGLPIEHVEGSWQANVTPAGDVSIALTNLHGLIYDGDAMATVSYAHRATQRTYEVAAMVRGLDLAPLASRWANRNASARSVEVGGRLDAHVSLTGDLNDVTSRRGEGRIEVREGRLYRLPVLWAILQVINLNVAADDVLEEAETDFFVEGNRILLDGIHLRGASIELFGNGTLTLPDHGVDLRLINISPSLWDNVPVVGSAVRRVSRGLLEFRVTGPIQQPTVRTTTLRGITDEIRSLFQPRSPRPIPPQR